MFYKTDYNSPVGNITLGADGEHIVGLWIKGQKYFADTVKEKMFQNDDLPVFQKAKNWLDRYFCGEKPEISELPLAPKGGEFRQMVWKILCEIPSGQVWTYGGAVGHNAISIIIPCHRVVGSNGSLTGYAGGLETKIKLLELEGVDMSGLFRPQKGTAL